MLLTYLPLALLSFVSVRQSKVQGIHQGRFCAPHQVGPMSADKSHTRLGKVLEMAIRLLQNAREQQEAYLRSDLARQLQHRDLKQLVESLSLMLCILAGSCCECQ